MAHTVTIKCPNHIVAKAFAMLAQDNCLQNLINTELDRVGHQEYTIDIRNIPEISVHNRRGEPYTDVFIDLTPL